MGCSRCGSSRKITVSSANCNDQIDPCTWAETTTTTNCANTKVLACVNGVPAKISPELLRHCMPTLTVEALAGSPINVTTVSTATGTKYVIDMACPETTGTIPTLAATESVLACTATGVKARKLDACSLGVAVNRILALPDNTKTVDAVTAIGSFTLEAICACTENWCLITGELNIDASI